MPAERVDAHIHLFAGGYRGLFTARPGVNIDEAACYQSLMADHGVTAALVVGYGAESWCTHNNRHLEAMAARHAWVRPLAFVNLQSPPSIDELDRLAAAGFVGLSFYIFNEPDIASLANVPAELWQWVAARRWLVSVNSRGAAWRAWLPILQQHNDLRLLVSHLGLPPKVKHPPPHETAKAAMADVLALAAYPNVHVKLSGFYAISDPGHDYPHRAAWPYVEAARRAFGTERLLWASDFAPCLDSLTFAQTLGVIAAMPFFDETGQTAVTGGNLLRLLGDVRSER
jgi:predicted TIM-barrel fold metal-dependent hydrolase